MITEEIYRQGHYLVTTYHTSVNYNWFIIIIISETCHTFTGKAEHNYDKL